MLGQVCQMLRPRLFTTTPDDQFARISTSTDNGLSLAGWNGVGLFVFRGSNGLVFSKEWWIPDWAWSETCKASHVAMDMIYFWIMRWWKIIVLLNYNQIYRNGPITSRFWKMITSGIPIYSDPKRYKMVASIGIILYIISLPTALEDTPLRSLAPVMKDW